MAIILIRHAKAGDRERWAEPDDLRPLTAKGIAQADALAVSLAGFDIRRVLSSPYLRCSQTVAPLAAGHGLVVEPCDELAEGHSRAGLTLARSLVGDAGDTVLCTHGDVMDAVLDGFGIEREGWARKAATWVLGAGEARYLAPPP